MQIVPQLSTIDLMNVHRQTLRKGFRTKLWPII
jgi:hypothetical protein